MTTHETPDAKAGARLYLDANAGIAARPEAIAAMAEALALGGNPSAAHREGRAARAVLERARREVAASVGAAADRVIFTSGGVEADHLALAQAPGARIASAADHPCVLEQTPAPLLAALDGEGRIDLADLARLFEESAATFLSLTVANNETGVLQPIADAIALARRHGAAVHLDAVQAFGKTTIDWGALDYDYLALSAHKIGGPKGVGALILGPRAAFAPTARGGGQEKRRRAGTENLAGAVGMGRACALVDPAAWLALEPLRDALEEALAARGCAIFGAGAARLANTLAFATPGVDKALQLMRFDLEGVAVSGGAACAAGKTEPSAALLAMGVDQALAACAIRLSMAPNPPGDLAARFLRIHADLPQAGARDPLRAAANAPTFSSNRQPYPRRCEAAHG